MPEATKTPSKEQIAERAYFLYLERGALAGYDVEDWLTAEKELLEEVNSEREQNSAPQPNQRDKALAATQRALG